MLVSILNVLVCNDFELEMEISWTMNIFCLSARPAMNMATLIKDVRKLNNPNQRNKIKNNGIIQKEIKPLSR
jgi:hypothetical protein